jgi:hypothetical protein
MKRALAAAFAVPLFALSLGAQRPQTESFTWSGELPTGGRVRIQNLNGNVMVEAGDGNKVVVTAAKIWRRGDPKSVRIEARQVTGGVIVCAIWSPTAPCDEGASDRGGRSQNNNDILVHFVVSVPRGARVSVNTTNGDVRVDAPVSDVSVASVNGSVFTRAVTGDITASTINGGVTAFLPDAPDVDVDLQTASGQLRLDFPLVVVGRLDPAHVRGKLGRGGRKLKLTTINGDISLRKG